MLNNKKAQIAETMTWVVATIIIIVILAIAIYAASIMSQANHTIEVDSNEPNVLLKKSLQGYLLTQEIIDGKEESVLTKLSGGSIDSFSGELGEKVFIDPTSDFKLKLELNSWEILKNYHKKIKINGENILGVLKYDQRFTTSI